MQRSFRDSLKAPYVFLADRDVSLVNRYGVKMLLLPIARRVTFVVGKNRVVLAVQEGNDAMDPSGAVSACSLKAAEALKFFADDAGATFVPVTVDGGVRP